MAALCLPLSLRASVLVAFGSAPWSLRAPGMVGGEGVLVGVCFAWADLGNVVESSCPTEDQWCGPGAKANELRLWAS